jgi:hypothetical protein
MTDVYILKSFFLLLYIYQPLTKNLNVLTGPFPNMPADSSSGMFKASPDTTTCLAISAFLDFDNSNALYK